MMEEKNVQEVKDTVKDEKVGATENLNEDELYARLQTEKLLKKKKTKKIATLASLCFAFAIAFIVIILATVPVSMKPNFLNSSDLEYLTFYGRSNSSPSTLYKNDEEDKQKLELFNKHFNESFNQTYLTALFAGTLNFYDVKEPRTAISDAELLRGESYAGSGNYLISLCFKQPQFITNQNGSIYKSNWGSPSLWDLKLKFTEACVVVSKDAGLKDTKIFVLASYPTFSGREQTGTEQRLVTITVKADTSKLFNAWSEFTR